MTLPEATPEEIESFLEKWPEKPPLAFGQLSGKRQFEDREKQQEFKRFCMDKRHLTDDALMPCFIWDQLHGEAKKREEQRNAIEWNGLDEIVGELQKQIELNKPRY